VDGMMLFPLFFIFKATLPLTFLLFSNLTGFLIEPGDICCQATGIGVQNQNHFLGEEKKKRRKTK